MRAPTVVAHRGASAVRPENTLAAFECAKAMGAGAIEFDVHATADGALVVHHDHLLDRTTSGTGLVFERDLAYVRSLDAGSWFDPAYATEQVPLLDEVLSIDALEFELELKGLAPGLIDGVIDTVIDHGTLERTEFTSWNYPMLLRLKERLPEARLGLFSRRREHWMPDAVFVETALSMAIHGRFDVVHLYACDVTAEAVERLHMHGLVVHANDAADPAEIRSAIESGVDRFSTNDVEHEVRIFREVREPG